MKLTAKAYLRIAAENWRKKYDGEIYFAEGFGAVRLLANNKWGFVDQNGKEVIPPKYEYVHRFSEGFAGFKLDGKWGFVDKTGKEVIPQKYNEVWIFKEGLAAVGLGEDKRGRKYGFVDKTGKEVIPVIYDFAVRFSEGLAAVNIGGSLYSTSENNYTNEVRGGKYGFIDKTGKVVIPLKYDWVGPFSEGLAAVKLNGKYGFIDKQDNIMIPPEYDDVHSRGKVIQVKLDNNWENVDQQNRKIPDKHLSAVMLGGDIDRILELEIEGLP